MKWALVGTVGLIHVEWSPDLKLMSIAISSALAFMRNDVRNNVDGLYRPDAAPAIVATTWLPTGGVLVTVEVR